RWHPDVDRSWINLLDGRGRGQALDRRAFGGLLPSDRLRLFVGGLHDRFRARTFLDAGAPLRGPLLGTSLGHPLLAGTRRGVLRDGRKGCPVGFLAGNARRLIVACKAGDDKGKGAQADRTQDGGSGSNQRPEGNGSTIGPAGGTKAALANILEHALGEVGIQ